MKKILFIIFLLFMVFPFNTYAFSYIQGDVDNNNIVSSLDYILVKRHILKTIELDSKQKMLADVNNDGNINSIDYIMIKKLIINKQIIRKERLKIGTMNIASYDCGTGSGGAKCTVDNQTLAKVFKENNLDIIGIQEGTHKRFKNKNDGVNELASLLNYRYSYVAPYQLNAALTHYEMKTLPSSESQITLNKCGEDRAISKSIITINGVDISVYVTHLSWESGCPELHLKHTAEIVKNDLNPIIVVGDYNIIDIDLFNKYFVPIGLNVAAYDDNLHSIKRISYMDSIWVNSKNHIDIINGETIHTHGTISDHNLVVATLDIY